MRVQKLCESRGGRPGLPVLITEPYGFCGRKATVNLNIKKVRAQELCESRGGRDYKMYYGIPKTTEYIGMIQ